MKSKQDWSIEWATFFYEYAGDFHSSFKEKLAKQLFAKGSSETGIRGFEKFDFQILIGQQDLKMQQIENNMFALVSFITPSAYSLPVWIYWTTEGTDVSNLHTQDVSSNNVEFHWGGNFPKEEVLPYLKPYKKEKKAKFNLHFDIEYYHNAFPDVSIEIDFVKSPEKEQLEAISRFFKDFADGWNNQNKDKFINYISLLIKKGENVYEIIADFGPNNSIKTIKTMLKEMSEKMQPNVISKIMVK